jgi:hypothetical protein
MKNFNKSESDFWDSDCFYQKGLERIWSASEYGHEPEIKSRYTNKEN